MNFKPLANKILIEEAPKESATKSGIIIPETIQKDGPLIGKVAAAGPGKVSEAGTIIPMSVKVGDKVFFKKEYGASEIEMSGKKYMLISEDDILAIVE